MNIKITKSYVILADKSYIIYHEWNILLFSYSMTKVFWMHEQKTTTTTDSYFLVFSGFYNNNNTFMRTTSELNIVIYGNVKCYTFTLLLFLASFSYVSFSFLHNQRAYKTL